jgi:hypothetical protein
MIQTFKIIHGIDDVDPSTWFAKVSDHHQKTRNAVSVSNDGQVIDELNLLKPKSRLEVRKNFFSCRVVDSWNSLPASVQGAKDVNGFKEAYDDFIGGDYHQ